MSVNIFITDETGNYKIFNNQLVNYSIDCRYDFIADSFTCTLVDNDADIQTGYWFIFAVDDNIEFRGLIETITRTISKNGRTVTVSGRSKTCILVDEYFSGTAVDYSVAVNPVSPWEIIDDLIAKTSFLTKSKTTSTVWTDPFMSVSELSDLNEAYNDDLAAILFDRIGSVHYTDEFKATDPISVKVDPGNTIWSKIKQILDETKFEALYQDSELYFGDLQKQRKNFPVYNLTQNDVISSKFTESIAQRYSTISLYSQPEYFNNYLTGGTDVRQSVKVVTDSTLKHKKYYTAQSSGDLLNKAIKLREDQRYTGYQLTYTVQSHIAPDGNAWKINRYCSVDDNLLNIHDKLVIYGRRFIFSASGGTITELSLSIERSNVTNL